MSRFAVGVDDQQGAEAPVLGSGERPGEEDEASSASAFMNAAWSLTAGCSAIPPSCPARALLRG